MELFIVDGIVFREDKVIVPDSLTSKLVSFAHGLHPRIVKTNGGLGTSFGGHEWTDRWNMQ